MDPRLTLTLRQLELFCAAADHGSFAAAAAAVHVTPNAVALAVRELETALDAHLCVRQRARGLTLTPSGLYLREHAHALLRDAHELQRSVSDASGPLRGPLAIGCYSTLAATVLPPLMEGFGIAHPGVEMSVVDGTMTHLLPLLRAGELDLIIGYRINLPADVQQALVYDTEVHVLLPADHPLADDDSVALHDLTHEQLILLDVPPSGDHTLDMLTRAGVTPDIGYRTSNYELVRSLVARGFGYSLLIQKPQIDVSYEGRPVVAKRIAPQLSAEAVVMLWPRSMRLSERARALVEFAQRTVPDQQWHPGDRSDAPASPGERHAG